MKYLLSAIIMSLPGLFPPVAAGEGMCLVACRDDQNGNYIDGDLRRIDFRDGEVVRTTGVIGYGRNARFSPDGRFFVSLQWDARTVTIATIDGGGVRTFNVEEPGVLSWTKSGIWIGSHGRITKYDTSGTMLSAQEFEWCNRAFVSRNERLAAGVWESGWFGVVYDLATGNSNRLEGWEQILNCSVCPNPSGTMVINNLYPKDLPEEQHTTMRLCDADGNTLEKLYLHEITGLPQGYYWNTQCWSGNSDDWILLPIGEKSGAFPVNDKNTSPWIYNRAKKKAYCLAHRTDDHRQPYDFFAGMIPSYEKPSLQLSKSLLSFSAIVGRNPTGLTISATTPVGSLEGIRISRVPSWLSIEITGDTDKFELINLPDVNALDPGLYIDTVKVTTDNAGNAAYQVLIRVTAADTPGSRLIDKLVISPEAVTITPGSRVSFLATAFDEHKSRLETDSCVWTVSGPGTISNTGIFDAGESFGGPYTISVTAFREEQVILDTAKVVVSNNLSKHIRINSGPNHLTPSGWKNDDIYVVGGGERTETSPLSTHGIPGAAPSDIYRGITTVDPEVTGDDGGVYGCGRPRRIRVNLCRSTRSAGRTPNLRSFLARSGFHPVSRELFPDFPYHS